MKYHTQLLTLDMDAIATAGADADAVRSRWTLSKIGTVEDRMEMDREMKSLEERLGVSSCQVIELELCLGGITQLKQTTDLLGATEELNDDETTSDWEVKKSRFNKES